jgi:hypothetical protein
MMWYATAELYYVSVLRFGIRDPGGAKWSHRHCTGPTFGRVSISLISCGHLTLAATFYSSPCGMGILSYLVHS